MCCWGASLRQSVLNRKRDRVLARSALSDDLDFPAGGLELLDGGAAGLVDAERQGLVDRPGAQQLHGRIGALIFQFEYLNRQKVSCQEEFESRLHTFFAEIQRPYPCTVETRNQQYLNDRYFSFLRGNRLFPCFLQGYYMPDLRKILPGRESWFQANDLAVIRLHGPDRQGMEKRTGKRWNRIVAEKDEEIAEILAAIGRLLRKGTDVYLNVNNHYEGSAPLTIAKIRDRLSGL